MKRFTGMLERSGVAVLLGIGLIFVATMFFAGCSSEGPTSFTSDESPAFTSDESLDGSSLLPSPSSTQPQFLRRPYPLAKPAAHDGEDEESFFYAEKLIEADKGGELEVGNYKFGTSELDVPAGGLSEDKILSMKVPKYGDLISTISQATFGEHGTVFAKPATVKLSYKPADLTGINEEDLTAWYWNEATGEWEDIGGEVDLVKKQVIFYIDHFSRYGLAPR